MDNRHKYAYRYLLDFTLGEIRSLLPPGWRFWTFQQDSRNVLLARDLAYHIQTISHHSAVDFECFDEEEFWKDFKRLGNQNPTFSLYEFRDAFERGLDQFVDCVPDGSQLVFISSEVCKISAKGLMILYGCLECEIICAGDEVIGVADRILPLRGHVVGIEQFNRSKEIAKRGEEVGIAVRGWNKFKLSKGTKLYRIPKQRDSSSADT